MADELTVTLRNSLDEIPLLADAVEGFCERQHVPFRAQTHVTLALDELVTNAITYGFDAGVERPDAILVRLALCEGELVVVMEDHGRRFDPLSAAPPDTTLSVEEREIGGLGLHFVRQFMTSVEYEWIDGTNRLTMRKRLDAGEGAA